MENPTTAPENQEPAASEEIPDVATETAAASPIDPSATKAKPARKRAAKKVTKTKGTPETSTPDPVEPEAPAEPIAETKVPTAKKAAKKAAKKVVKTKPVEPPVTLPVVSLDPPVIEAEIPETAPVVPAKKAARKRASKKVAEPIPEPVKSEDIHTATAAKEADVEPAEVTADMRRTAKMDNFGSPYGQPQSEIQETPVVALDQPTKEKTPQKGNSDDSQKSDGIQEEIKAKPATKRASRKKQAAPIQLDEPTVETKLEIEPPPIETVEIPETPLPDIPPEPKHTCQMERGIRILAATFVLTLSIAMGWHIMTAPVESAGGKVRSKIQAALHKAPEKKAPVTATFTEPESAPPIQIEGETPAPVKPQEDATTTYFTPKAGNGLPDKPTQFLAVATKLDAIHPVGNRL